MTLAGLASRWPQKLGALVLAVFVWFFVDINDTSVLQRGLIVPVEVQGLAETATASGIPDTISLTVSGPSNLVNTLSDERLSAVLSLDGVTGAFQERIEVLVPQGVQLLELTPEEVSGTVESLASKSVPVELIFTGTGPRDAVLEPSYSSESVNVRGLGSVLERVNRVLATAQPAAGEQTAPLYAVDESGTPVVHNSLGFEPPMLQVSVTAAPVLHTKSLPVEVEPPDTEPFELSAFSVSQPRLNVGGPAEALEALERVQGTVELDTARLEPGEYTFRVTPQLPEGVAALERVTVRLSLSEPPEPDPRPDESSDGESDDLPDSTVRRPDSAEDGESRDDFQ